MTDFLKGKEIIVLVSDRSRFPRQRFLWGGDVYMSDSKEDIVAALDSGRFSLLLCEAASPDGDIKAFCRDVKHSRRFRHIPVIVFSFNSDGDAADYLNAGVDVFLFRPTLSVLKAQTCSILKNREYLRDYHIGGCSEELHPESDADHEFFTKLKDYVESNLDRPELSVPIIASALNMSASNLFRKIQQVTGITPNVFLNEMRMTRAVSLLKENRYEISEIGLMVGYSSHSYFSKCFKARFGMAPKEYLEYNRNIINQNENK
ncbi:MAG: helix-turn-helix domain-containing protein [Candidatus Cryptobacteroides sp.]